MSIPTLPGGSMVPTHVTARVTRRRISAGLAAAFAATALAACGSSSHNSGSGTTAQAAASNGSSGSGSGSLKGQTLTYWASVEGAGPSDTNKTLTRQFQTFTAQTG